MMELKMSVSNEEQRQVDGLEELPEFDLEYLYDDDDRPSEVTIFCDEPEHLSTQWITIDKENAVPLEEIR